MDCWKNYKNELTTDGKHSLATIFEENPKLENENITITIYNKALEDEFNSTKNEVLGYFREKLSNYNLQIETELNENPQNKKAYTPHEKFAKMSEKNPAIIDLAKKLNADVGYPSS